MNAGERRSVFPGGSVAEQLAFNASLRQFPKCCRPGIRAQVAHASIRLYDNPDYAIGGSKLKSSETSARRCFPSLRPAAIIEDCSWSFEAAFQGSANGGLVKPRARQSRC